MTERTVPVPAEPWQPIKTAPKDGTRLILMAVKSPRFVRLPDILWVKAGSWRTYDGDEAAWREDAVACPPATAHCPLSPTHWQTLAAAPSPSPARNGGWEQQALPPPAAPSPAELWPDDHSPSDPAGGGYSGGDLRGNLRGHVSPAEDRNRNISPMTEGTTSPSFPAAPSPAAEETAWLIERPATQYMPLAWWGHHGWSLDTKEALRLSRKEDAEAIIYLNSHRFERTVIATEHIWSAPAKPAPSPAVPPHVPADCLLAHPHDGPDQRCTICGSGDCRWFDRHRLSWFPTTPSPAHVERARNVAHSLHPHCNARPPFDGTEWHTVGCNKTTDAIAAAFAQVEAEAKPPHPYAAYQDEAGNPAFDGYPTPPSAPPSPAVGQRETLTADFARALPGGSIDDSTFEAIECALDRAEAPMRSVTGGWLTLAERVTLLATSSRASGFAAGIEAAAVKAHEAYAEYWRLSNEQGNHFRAWQAQNSEADGEQVGDMPDGGPGASLPDFIASAIRLIEEGDAPK